MSSSSNGGVASAAPAVRKDATPAQLAAFEAIVVDAFETVDDVDEAERLLAAVTTAVEAARLAKLGADKERWWRGVKLRAEALHGELLGPAKVGGTKGNKNAKNGVSAANIVQGAERVKQHEARKVAAAKRADPKGFDDYVEKDPKPSREGLLRKVGRAKAKPKPVDPRNRKGKRPTKAERRGVLWLLHDTVVDFTTKLEHIDPAVVDAQDPLALGTLIELRDAMISFEVWRRDLELHLQAKIGDQGIREKIATLRNPAGKYPAELKRCQEVADELERRLNRKLSS